MIAVVIGERMRYGAARGHSVSSVGVLLLLLLAPTPVVAQDSLPPWEGGFTTSLGVPPRTRWYTGGSLGLSWQGTPDTDPSPTASSASPAVS